MFSTLKDLEEKGYAVVKGVLSEEKVRTASNLFYEWINDVENTVSIQDTFYGMIKEGHQKHSWFIKTDPDVQAVFKKLWNTDDLVTGFDGTCWIPRSYNAIDTCWTHTDQAAAKKGLHCVQGFVSLTANTERTFVAYEGSHLLHETYMKDRGLTGARNWRLIDPEYLKEIESSKRVVKVNAGDMVLWDSRTFHQSQYGTNEERLVQYVCFLPRNHEGNTPGQQRQRLKYFKNRRTTTHWPYPLCVNTKTEIPVADLSEYEERIKCII
jgi:ectoine hydroxylase-related dioxygenase (phytanoyl-CoA dioxygenase family)